MTPKQFSVAIASYYKEPLMVDGKPNIRITSIEKWATNKDGLNNILNTVISKFIPTGINPCPLISHLELLVAPNNDIEVARDISDRIINAVSKYGYTMLEEAKAYIGEVGWHVVKRYGGWVRFSQELRSDQLEIVRSHLRDSAVTVIGKIKRNEALDMPINLEKITNPLVKQLSEQKSI